LEPKEKLLWDFLSLLGQFKLSQIRKCQREDCGKYYLKATKKEKRYCSNKCAWVMASRQRQKEQPEKEREKKRESYKKKIDRVHGKIMRIQKRVRKEG
jgi:hypothetical protein